MGNLFKNECFICVADVLEVIVIHIAKKPRFAYGYQRRVKNGTVKWEQPT
ncbi:hypothetical protein ACIQ4Z_14900 [Peribacillus asahii]